MAQAAEEKWLGEPLPIEVLEIWYDFMQASDRANWNQDMREHLGPRADESFEEWRSRCREDMVLVSNWYFEIHEDLEAFKGWYVPKEDFPELNEVHLTVNLDNPKLVLKKAFAELLDQLHEKGRGRPTETIRRAFFQPNGEVNVAALRKTLGVHLAYEKNAKVRAVEVARDVLEMDIAKLDGVGRRSAQAEVSRQRRKAKAILHGVELCRFPNPDKSPGGA